MTGLGLRELISQPFVVVLQCCICVQNAFKRSYFDFSSIGYFYIRHMCKMRIWAIYGIAKSKHRVSCRDVLHGQVYIFFKTLHYPKADICSIHRLRLNQQHTEHLTSSCIFPSKQNSIYKNMPLMKYTSYIASNFIYLLNFQA